MELITRRYLCLLVLLLAGARPSQSFNFLKRLVAGPDKERYQDDYDLINEQLVRSIQSEEPLENLVEAQNWLREKSDLGDFDDDEEQQSALRRSHSRQNALRQIKDINSRALVQLNMLLRLLDRPKCSLFDYELLRRNELSTGTHLSLPLAQVGPMRRIDSVVRQVLVYHAEQCRFEYPKVFEWTKKHAPAGLLLEIRRLMNKIIETSQTRVFATLHRPMDASQILKEKALGVSMTGKAETRALLGYLRRRSRETPDSRYLGVLGDSNRRGSWIVVEPKVAQLFEQYAVNLCERLNRAFGFILRPATFEQQIYDGEHKYRAINDETSELIIVLQYHRLCNEMLENRRTVEKNLVAAIWDEL